MRIKATYLISAQPTADFETSQVIPELVCSTNNKLEVIEPSWKNYIPSNQLRRMGKAVRIGSGAGLKLIEQNIEFQNADAIILSSANGGLEDCVKFLKQMIIYGDGPLTPTNFVQSTPNAISGSIAMATKNQAYNMTHVNSSFAFIDAIRDADMFIHDAPDANILLGCVEEISEYNYNINKLKGDFKSTEINSAQLYKEKSNGTICGEGAAFFGLTKDSGDCAIAAYDTLLSSNEDENIKFVIDFINENSIKPDTILMGYNGDARSDGFYQKLENECFIDCNIITFKELFGEHPSVISNAFWYACQLFKGMPEINGMKVKTEKPIKHMLIINQYQGQETSLIYLKA